MGYEVVTAGRTPNISFILPMRKQRLSKEPMICSGSQGTRTDMVFLVPSVMSADILIRQGRDGRETFPPIPPCCLPPPVFCL